MKVPEKPYSEQRSIASALLGDKIGALPLLEEIAANLPGMIFQFLQRQDGSHFVLYVSSGCQELYELEPEIVKADFQVLRKLIHPQDIKAFEESVTFCTTTVTLWRWEGRVITPSGKLKWIEGAARPEQQANGDIVWEGLIIDITSRKQAEEKLRESEARYKAILDAIPDMMFRISRDGEYLDFKGEGANVTIPREQLIGKNLRDLLPADVALMSQEAIAKTLDSRILQTCEYQLPTPLGMRDYEARLVISGKDEVLAIVRDITASKQALIRQQSLTAKFSKAFRCSPNAITISTLDEGRYLEVNDSFVRLSGYERDEAIGHTAFELNIWVNQSDRTQLLQQLQEFGVVSNLEFEFRRKSGEVLIGLVSAEVIDLDGTPCVLAVNNDITERKQAEAQLKLAAQRDRLLAETLGRIRRSLNLDQILQTTVTEVREFLQADRVFVGLNDANLGTKTLAESVNPQYPSVFGWTTDNQTLQELRKLLKTNRVRVVEDIEQIAASPKLKALYQQFQTRATLAVPIMLGNELFGVLIAQQCSKPRHWQPIEIDLLQQLSEQIAIAIQQAQLYQELAELNANLECQVEERTSQLQQKMQEIEDLNRLKDVVLHTISHELRTSVLGTLMVLQNLRSSPGDQILVSRSIIERMIQGNDNQLAMINSLLEINGSVAQGIILHRQQMQLSTLLETISHKIEPILAQNQATLTNLVPTDLPLIMADPNQLQRVLDDLLTHSLKHNPPGLNLTLKATVETGMIRLTIQDNGVAMNKLECDRLFDLYVHNPQARSSTSTGLKLYLCRQIISAHGGEIGVSSNRKHGLTVWFTVPLSTQSTTSPRKF